MVLGVAEVPEFFSIEMLYLYFANRNLLRSFYLLSSGSFSNYTFIVYQDCKIVIWRNLYYLILQLGSSRGGPKNSGLLDCKSL